MATHKRAAQESPRDLKHMAIHALVVKGFLVFSNIAAKGSIDLVIGIPKSNELRVAGVRIKTGSYREKYENWYFSEDTAKHFIEKPNFFYIFCLKTNDLFKPILVVISSKDLANLIPTIRDRNGNYGFSISKNQVEGKNRRGRSWADYIGEHTFEKIRQKLEA